MARAPVNGIELEYQVAGNPTDSPVLLITGFGAQMTVWDEEFVLGLTRRGHFAICFDNRDVGLSTKLEGAPIVTPGEIFARRSAGQPVNAAYTLNEMADDAAGLVAHLGLVSVNAVGVSMGGMIAQMLALRHPERVRTLVSIMSSTGNPALPPAKPAALLRLASPVPSERSAYVAHTLATQRLLSGDRLPFDEARARRTIELGFDRSFYPAGRERQLAAIMASGNRKAALAQLRAPTLVIHGREDPLVPVEAGIDTHQAIANSELLLIDGMGHSLPPPVWPIVLDAIQKHAARGAPSR